MEVEEGAPTDAFDTPHVPFGPPAVGMGGPVQHTHQLFDRPHGRIVFVLPDGRDDLSTPLDDFFFGAGCAADHVGDQIEHRLEILRETGAHERHGVPRDRDAESNAAPVEILRDRIRRAARGSTVDDAREEIRRSDRIFGVTNAAGWNTDVQGDRRCRRRLLDDDTGAVRQHLASGGKPVTGQGGHYTRCDSGSNQPMVRLLGTKYVRAAFVTSSVVTARMRAGREV